MAANYWTSTQRKSWTFTTEKLAEVREAIEKPHAQILDQHPYPDRRLMFIFLKDRLLQLAKRLQFRQQCVATALVYLHRYFLSTPMQNVNLYLLTATAFYLASKTEESPHHIRLVASEARQAWPEFVPGDVSRLGEMEFCLISEMRSQLIVWHPYRSLVALKEHPDLKLTNDELGLAWSIINDSFLTDLPLTCAPHLTAIIAMFLSVVFLPVAKAANALRPLSHDTLMNPDSGLFSSLGGRQGMASAFGNAMHGLPIGSAGPTTTLSQGGNGNANGAPRNMNGDSGGGTFPSDREKAAAAIKESEKMTNVVRFLVESEIDLHRMIEGTQEIISLYEVWEQYSEKAVKEAVSKCLKSQRLDS